MAKSKKEEEVNLTEKTDNAVNDNAVNETVSPDPKGDEDTGVKVVNIPLSASNALQPEAGIQVGVPEGATEEFIQTDAYDPQKTKVQNEIVDDEVDGRVSKAKYEALGDAFREVLSNHVLDVVHRDFYLAKAGLPKHKPVAEGDEANNVHNI